MNKESNITYYTMASDTILDLGRISTLGDALIALVREQKDVMFEIECDPNELSSVSIRKDFDFLYGIRTEPPLPLELYFNEYHMIDSMQDETGLVFTDPIPVSLAVFCDLNCKALQSDSIPFKFIVKAGLNSNIKETFLPGNRYIVDLPDDRQLIVVNGNYILQDRPDSHTKKAIST